MTTQSHVTTIHIFVEIDRNKQVKVEFDTDDVTGLQIKQKAGVPPDYELARIEGNRRIAVADGQLIEIKNGEHFIAVPSGNVS
jgi:hypothetical protein